MTKHTCGGPAFGRLTAGCPRCDELKAGAPARRMAWTERAAERRQDEANRLRWIKAHDCKAAGCAPICTYGDW